MCEAMGAAPGAKWGDLTTAIYTAAGDVTYLSCHGVIAFSAILHHPIRYIMKYWKDEPTVGINPGDGFIHNDARFGNVHNTDQSMIMPVMRNGQIIAWVAATIHEGENGACEPGGMPSGSETPFDDGLRMSPVQDRRARPPPPRPAHLPAALGARPEAAACRPEGEDRCSATHQERIDAIIDEVGVETFVAALRITVEDVEAEVRRRISELPDGTVRFNQFMDSTLKENILIKFACEITVKGDKMTDRSSRHRSGDSQPGHQLAAVLGQIHDDAGDPGVLVAGPAALHLGDVSPSRSSPTSTPGPTPATTHPWASPCRRPSAASPRCRPRGRSCSSPTRRSSPT